MMMMTTTTTIYQDCWVLSEAFPEKRRKNSSLPDIHKERREETGRKGQPLTSPCPVLVSQNGPVVGEESWMKAADIQRVCQTVRHRCPCLYVLVFKTTSSSRDPQCVERFYLLPATTNRKSFSLAMKYKLMLYLQLGLRCSAIKCHLFHWSATRSTCKFSYDFVSPGASC